MSHIYLFRWSRPAVVITGVDAESSAHSEWPMLSSQDRTRPCLLAFWEALKHVSHEMASRSVLERAQSVHTRCCDASSVILCYKLTCLPSFRGEDRNTY